MALIAFTLISGITIASDNNNKSRNQESNQRSMR